MNERYIAVSTPRNGFGGHWGVGAIFEEAKKNLRKAGGSVAKANLRAWKFESKLLFAPTGRPSTTEEADCYVDVYGGINWIRCNRTQRLENGVWIDIEF